MMKRLIKRINNNSATIGIIGLGYVGLPLVIRFVEENFEVIGFDIDGAKCNSLNSGKSYIRHISAEFIGNYDLVILTTDHDQYDYEYLQKNSKLIVDTRGPFKRNQSNIISA